MVREAQVRAALLCDEYTAALFRNVALTDAALRVGCGAEPEPAAALAFRSRDHSQSFLLFTHERATKKVFMEKPLDEHESARARRRLAEPHDAVLGDRGPVDKSGELQAREARRGERGAERKHDVRGRAHAFDCEDL